MQFYSQNPAPSAEERQGPAEAQKVGPRPKSKTSSNGSTSGETFMMIAKEIYDTAVSF